MKRFWISFLVIVAGVFFFGYRELERRSDQRKDQSLTRRFERIDRALDEFRLKCGRYPLTAEGLTALSKKPSGIDCPEYPTNGFVPLTTTWRDPWGGPYIYSSHLGRKFVLKSLGGGGRPRGIEKPDSDIAVPVSVSQ